jgi:thioredoxin 1
MISRDSKLNDLNKNNKNSENMLKLKNYTWAIIVATGLFAVAGSNICCTGKASSNDSNTGIQAPAASSNEKSSGSVIVLNENNFDEYISKGVVLVDFWATWCKPCRMQGPVIEEVSTEMKGKASICKLDIDANPSVTERFNIQSIPTLLIFKDGKVVNKFIGVTAKDDIVNALNKFIK